MQGVAPCKMDLSGFGIFHKLPKLKFGHEIWNNDDLQVSEKRRAVHFHQLAPTTQSPSCRPFSNDFSPFTLGLYFSPDGYKQFGWWGFTCGRLLL